MQGAARGLKLTRVTPIRYNMAQSGWRVVNIRTGDASKHNLARKRLSEPLKMSLPAAGQLG